MVGGCAAGAEESPNINRKGDKFLGAQGLGSEGGNQGDSFTAHVIPLMFEYN